MAAMAGRVASRQVYVVRLHGAGDGMRQVRRQTHRAYMPSGVCTGEGVRWAMALWSAPPPTLHALSDAADSNRSKIDTSGQTRTSQLLSYSV